MSRPGIALIFLQAIKIAHILRVAAGLENAHIFARRKDIGTVKLVVYPDYAAGDEFALVKLAGFQLGVQRRDKIAPDHRLIGNVRMTAHRDFRQVHNVEVPFQEFFTGVPRGLVIIKDMERVKILIFRINAITGKAAAKAVGAVVHGGNRGNDARAVNPGALLPENAGDGTARGNAHLPFFLQHGDASYHKRY